MGDDQILGFIDVDKTVCTFCGATPIVGFSFDVNADSLSPEHSAIVDKSSFIAVCKDHAGILEEQLERDGFSISDEGLNE